MRQGQGPTRNGHERTDAEDAVSGRSKSQRQILREMGYNTLVLPSQPAFTDLPTSNPPVNNGTNVRMCFLNNSTAPPTLFPVNPGEDYREILEERVDNLERMLLVAMQEVRFLRKVLKGQHES